MAGSWRDELRFDKDYDWWKSSLSLPVLATLRIPRDEHMKEDEEDDDDEPDPTASLQSTLAELKRRSLVTSPFADPEKMIEFMQQMTPPGTNLDEPVPGYGGKTMRELMRESAEKTAIIVRGARLPEFAEAQRKAQEAIDERERRRKLGQFEVTLAGEDGGQPYAAQVAAVEYLLANEAHVTDVLLGAAVEYAKSVAPTYRRAWTGLLRRMMNKMLPAKLTPAAMRSHVDFSGVHVTSTERDGVAYVEYAMECTWDEEHGLMVALHRDRVVHAGMQGEGWEDNA
jgi:hypothetical protein